MPTCRRTRQDEFDAFVECGIPALGLLYGTDGEKEPEAPAQAALPAECEANRQQLCRYITRPALANARVRTNAEGQVVLKLKTPWRDGTTHLVMSPLEFMQRLAARAI